MINRGGVYKILNPTSQTKQKMGKEMQDFVLNPNVPDTTNNHREIYSRFHPDETLTQDDCIHHINGNHNDNRIENLIKLTSKQHRLEHWRMWKEEKKINTGS